MLWLGTAVGFGAYSAVIWVAFWLYAITLLKLPALGRFAKYILGMIIYLLFIFIIVSPILIGFIWIESLKDKFNSSAIFMVYVLICYLGSVVPGGLYFKKNYLNRLRMQGYFTKR